MVSTLVADFSFFWGYTYLYLFIPDKCH